MTAQERTLRHIASLSSGGPVDPRLRVTLNFHPDREADVEAAAHALPCPVEWHPGFRLTVEELRRHRDYRGRESVELGARIARGGLLDPRVIGDAARTGRHDPQSLKRVWHCVARWGG